MRCIFLAIALSMATSGLLFTGDKASAFVTAAGMPPVALSDETASIHWNGSPIPYERTRDVVLAKQLSVPVLMYHDITYLPGNSLGMAPGQFAAEMNWLQTNGFHPIHLGQLYAALYHGYALPVRPIVITFDDGYERVYTAAFPILERHRFAATVFMISGAVRQRGRYPMLTWDNLATMESSSLVDVESHTVHHIDLSTASLAVQRAELLHSEQTLARHLHHPIVYFCYPSGKYNERTIQALRDSGYRLAFTVHSGFSRVSQGPYGLHRIRVQQGMRLADFARAVRPPTAAN